MPKSQLFRQNNKKVKNIWPKNRKELLEKGAQ